jgi:DHA1 family inner membrane transport protein
MRAVLTVLVLWAAGLGAAAQFGKISVLYETLGKIYADHAGVEIALMVSIVGIVGLIFGTTAGLLVARIGPRRAILTALALGAFVSLVQSFFPNYLLMMLTRILEGVSHLTIVVVAPTVIAGVTSARYQGLAMTLWSSFFGVTYAALAYFAPTFIADQGPGALLLAHGAWMAGCFILVWALVLADPKHSTVQGQGSLLAQHVAIYASPSIAAPATGFVFYTVTYVAILTLLPANVIPEWGGFVAVAMPLISIAISLTLGVWLLSKMQAFRLVQAGFALAIFASLGLWSLWGQGQAEAGFALLLSAAMGIVQGASFASLAQINPNAEDRARGAGAIAQLGNLGTTIGTPMLAWIMPHAGVNGLAVFLIGFSALGIAVHALQARRRLAADRTAS